MEESLPPYAEEVGLDSRGHNLEVARREAQLPEVRLGVLNSLFPDDHELFELDCPDDKRCVGLGDLPRPDVDDDLARPVANTGDDNDVPPLRYRRKKVVTTQIRCPTDPGPFQDNIRKRDGLAGR
jgi:hypothetical protein